MYVSLGSRDLSAELDKDIMKAQEGKKENPRLLTHLRSLAELARSAPDAFEKKSEEVMRFVLQKILYRKGNSPDVSGRVALNPELMEAGRRVGRLAIRRGAGSV